MDSAHENGSDYYCYLTDISERDKPWDRNKALTQELGKLYRDTDLSKLSDRIKTCSGYLEFGWIAELDTGEIRLKLKSARFCRCRHCIVCQWRRSLMWVARFLKALPSITRDYPTARFVFLTLTVRNCELTELRSTLAEMNKAWKRLQLRKQFPALGFARSTEVTRGKDGTAHPHFHCLLMVKAGYFKTGQYLSQQEWTELWKDCLRVQYTPIVNVKAVRPNKKRAALEDGELPQDLPAGQAAIAAAIVETFKYTVKPEDLIGRGTEIDRQWLVELTNQLHKTRAIALGGVFKQYLSESEPEDLIGESDEDEPLLDDTSLWFGWREMVKRYAKVERDG